MKNVEITSKEKQFINSLIKLLYAEPGFSDVDVKDMSKETGMSVNSCKGVLGSLVNKGLLFTYEMECGGNTNHDLIYLGECIYDYHKEWKGYSDKEQINLIVKGETNNQNCNNLKIEKMEELLKKLKKNTTANLVKKADKASGEELEAILEVLRSRNQDVSKWETAAEVGAPDPAEEVTDTDEKTEEEVKAAKIAELDVFIEKCINESRTGIYNEIMKSLGGKFDDEIEELYASATIKQIEEALSFQKILKPTEEKKPVKKAAAAKAKVVKKAATSSEGLKSQTLESFTDNDEFKLGSKIEFEISGTAVIGEIKRFFLCHKTGKEKCRIKVSDGKIYFKTADKIKLVNE